MLQDPQDELLANLLATGATHEEAATKCRVHRQTVWRRNRDPVFRARVQEIRRAAVDRVISQFSGYISDALARLHLIASADDTKNPDAIKASIAILEIGRKYMADAELDERLKRIEDELDISHSQTDETGSDPGLKANAEGATIPGQQSAEHTRVHNPDDAGLPGQLAPQDHRGGD